jgi:hypothetical protein
MIEKGMMYDEEPETGKERYLGMVSVQRETSPYINIFPTTGTLTPTEFNVKENLDIPEVRDEFSHLYKYGMMMMSQGLVTADEIKTTVLERLIKRTGLEPEEFDKWLGY